jgi:2,5-dichloro-2,5-cyclohexadiene-1,4-diol dehydrogenase 1
MPQASAQAPFQQLSLKDRVIIVSGAGSGIGASAARLAASRGAAVIAADINAGSCEAVAAEIRQQGGEVTVFTGDLASESQVRAMIALALKRYGKLHGAFNNAGITSKGTPLTEMPIEEWQRMIDTNLTSVFLCLKHQIAHLKQHGGGSIVNTASGAGVVGFPGVIDYCAAKHGVVGLTRAAAIDYAAHGVRVNAVLPGGIETPMLTLAMAQDPNIRPAIETGHLLARLGQPIEIAEAVAFLLSDAASFITGAAMAVDGGYTCR